jgi:hypothetical protein
MFHLMTAIPFGVSYFPVGWSSADNGGDGNDSGGETSQPLILMTVMTTSTERFHYRKGSLWHSHVFFHRRGTSHLYPLFTPNPIGLQMVENVPVLSRTRVHLH